MTTSQALQPLHVAPGPAHDNEMMAGPNEQRSHSKLTPARYLLQIERHSESSGRTSLYQGDHFICLADFLKRGFGKPLSSDEADKFATFYRLENDEQSPSPAKLSLPGYPVSDGEHLLISETAIIFLQGYPSARGIVDLGATYEIDPEFYQRHLSFLKPRVNKNESLLLPLLPSFQTTILQLPLTTIGRHVTPQYKSVAEKRLHSASKMDEYLLGLRKGSYMGRKWEPRDSIVRSFAVHDENEFSIQQIITICTTSITGADDCWKVFLWLDVGRPLNSSPLGPWSSPVDDIYLIPTGIYKPGIAMKDHRYPAHRSKVLDRNELVQNISILPLAFSRSLHPKILRQDPFYALSEIFDLVATSEMQFLTAIDKQLDDRSRSKSIRSSVQNILFTKQSSSNLDLHADLSYFRNLLEDHVNSIENTNRFIKTRHDILRWPRSTSEKAQLAARRIEYDYEALLTRARKLRDRCEWEMGVLLSKAQLSSSSQTKPGGRLEMKRDMMKLTMLLAVFLPVIATSTVFGMGFLRFGSEVRGVWVWVVTTVLLVMISLVGVFWDGEILRRWWRKWK